MPTPTLRTAGDFPPEVLRLFDEYVHNLIDRRTFLEGAGKFAASGLTAAAFLEALSPRFASNIDLITGALPAQYGLRTAGIINIATKSGYDNGGQVSLIGESLPGESRRLGGLCEPIAREISRITGKETRSLVLGHLQRGGQPTGYDRLLATRFGGAAVRAVADGKWGHMVALQSPNIVTIPIEEALREPKRVDPLHDTVLTARACGISFGD